MPKRVLSIGQCSVDHAAIAKMLKNNFAAAIVPVDTAEDALQALGREKFALVLVNRKLDADYSDGLEIIRQIKADPQLAATPCMLVTNYPEHQQAAVAVGAEPGFGKLAYHEPQTRERLARFLGE
jgi:two-component system chemotaxis response regulator CheY